MATRLTKPVTRVASTRKYGDIIVMLTPAGIVTREKGKRTTYGPLPIEYLHERGALLKARQTVAEKQAAREASGGRSRRRARIKVGI